MKFVISFGFVFLFLSQNLIASENNYFILPFATRLEGVGSGIGIGAGFQNLTKFNMSLAAGKSFSDLEAYGFQFGIFPLANDLLKLSASKAVLEKAKFETTYIRGLEKPSNFLQEVSGEADFIGLDLFFFKKKLKLGLLFGSTVLKLEKYYTENNKQIDIQSATLLDVETKIQSFQIAVDLTQKENNKAKGLAFDFRGLTQTGRVGLSETFITTYNLKYIQPLAKTLSLYTRFFRSDASVTKKNKKYDSALEVENGFGGDCSAITDSFINQRCEDLKDEIAGQILAENLAGTANPLGGAYSLRSFREFRFKAQHTSSLNLELAWDFSQQFTIPFFKNKNRLSLAPFYELGYADEIAGDLYDRAVQTYGLEIQAHLDKIPLRIGSAWGSMGSYAWYLAIGHMF